MNLEWTMDPALEAREGSVDYAGGRTWVATVGDGAVEQAGGIAPLLLLHGGPGACHDYLESLAAISATGRRVIFYDQQGCGNSDQPDDPGRWTVDFYLGEIDAVRSALGLARCHILGQSWGGMLLMEYLLRRPALGTTPNTRRPSMSTTSATSAGWCPCPSSCSARSQSWTATRRSTAR